MLLQGREISSLPLREEHRLMVFENRLLRRVLRQKKDEMTGGRKKVHSGGIRDLNCSPSEVRIIKSRSVGRAGHEARMGKRNAYSLLIIKTGGKRLPGRHRCRWVDNIGIDLGNVHRYSGMDWICLVQYRDKWIVVMKVMVKIWVQYDYGNLISSCTTGGLPTSAHLHTVIYYESQ
jgi:hypothetical protein